MKLRYTIITMLLALLLAACGTNNAPATTGNSGAGTSTASISVRDPWARATAGMSDMNQNAAEPTAAAMDMSQPTDMAMEHSHSMGDGINSAAYMTIANSGGTADRLVRASSTVAQTVELHTVVEQGGVMSMQQVEAIDVPANGEVALKPGGFHVMLIGVNQDLMPGQKIMLTLEFEQAGSMMVEAEVRAP